MSSYNLRIDVLKNDENGIELKLTGELDQLTVRDLKEKLQELTADMTPSLTVDLSEIEFMASAGLSVFAYYHELYQNNAVGQILKITNCSDSVMRVFKLTKMDKIFNVS
ncbi:MAG: anti-sigma factor antagonist [Clostridiales bacterium]|nr:anti-sigma factor antagonist [Clostridiales bacterium]MDN5280913.1 anti-sigma factor antagonist [Candidatus Ozemobacter sp.]